MTLKKSEILQLIQFANIENDNEADEFIKKNSELVQRNSIHFVFSHAIDCAKQGAELIELAQMSRRCALLKNLSDMCSKDKPATIGVEEFYTKMATNKQWRESYKNKLHEQVRRLMEKIETLKNDQSAGLCVVQKSDDKDDQDNDQQDTKVDETD